MYLNHSETISPTPVHGKIIFHETGDKCQKGLDDCSRITEEKKNSQGNGASGNKKRSSSTKTVQEAK